MHVDSGQDMVAVTTIRAMTQLTEQTIRLGLPETNWTQLQCRKDDDTSDKMKVCFILFYSICQN